MKDQNEIKMEAVELKNGEIAYSAKGKVVNVSGVLNVRSRPSTSGVVIGTLSAETTVEITAKNGEWYKISLPTEGYVYSNYIQVSAITLGPMVSNSAGSNWLIPAIGKITAIFPTYPSGGNHNGIDIANSIGTPILASKSGIVILVQNLTTSYGKWIKIDHGNGVTSLYAHNSKILVNVGDRVSKGDLIAIMGTTGNSTGIHCHWSVQVNGTYINPQTKYKVGDIIKR